ncbi:hypothetical protein ABT124_15805 [Streptomyces sp. NPDC001982]|uniref:hypothetical protein n=1 Tax=Streptomyces sp. NPDC001982 TaxID=3154405 RepID=UPI00332C465F
MSALEGRFKTLAAKRRELRALLRDIDAELKDIVPQLRHETDLTQEQIARAAGLAVPTVRAWTFGA